MPKHEDLLPGGLADKKKPSDFSPRQLRKGQKVESEHTRNRKLTREIAMDHLSEDPNYYDKLDLIEKAAFISFASFSDELVRIAGGFSSKTDLSPRSPSDSEIIRIGTTK